MNIVNEDEQEDFFFINLNYLIENIEDHHRSNMMTRSKSIFVGVCYFTIQLLPRQYF